MENKKYSLEEIIDLSQRFDDILAVRDSIGLESWINEIKDSVILDSSFHKHFNQMVIEENLIKAEWFFEIILPFVSYKMLEKVFKEVCLKGSVVSDDFNLVVDLFTQKVSDNSWKNLINSCKINQILWLSQNIKRDLSFFWEAVSSDEAQNFISSIYITPFAKKTLNRNNFYLSLSFLYSKISSEDRINILRKNVISSLFLLDSQSNISLPVIFDMIKIIYSEGGIKYLENWPEFLDWINQNLNEINQFKTIVDFALCDLILPEWCTLSGGLLIETNLELRIYFIKEKIEKSFNNEYLDYSLDVDDFKL